MNGRTPPNLLPLLDKYFNTTDLRELASTLGIAYENLVGDSKKGRMISLIEYAEQHQKVDVLLALVVEKRPFLRGKLARSAVTNGWRKVLWFMVFIVVVIIAIKFWPEPSPNDEILLQVQVNSGVDRSPIANATVRLDIAGQLFSPQRTDLNGRAVFELPDNLGGELIQLTVEDTGFGAQTQKITLESEAMLLEFQLAPLP